MDRRWGLLALLIPALGIAAAPDRVVPFSGPSFWLYSWGLAALGGGAYGLLAGRGIRGGLGMALMLVPVATTLVGILNDLAPLIRGGTVLGAVSQYRLSTFYSRSILTNLGYVGAGFLLWSRWTIRDGIDVVATRLAATGFPMGHRSEAASMHIGWLLLPVILFASALIQLTVTQQVPELVNSDETSIWDKMTPFHAIMISAAAALGEEAVYRGVMMTGLAVVGMRMGLHRTASWSTALVAQAIVFGFAHGGYGNWLHVIQATLFGFISGAMALLFGIWSAIVVHFLIDIYALGVHADVGWWIVFLTTMLIGNTFYTIGWSAWKSWQWFDRRQAA